MDNDFLDQLLVKATENLLLKRQQRLEDANAEATGNVKPKKEKSVLNTLRLDPGIETGPKYLAKSKQTVGPDGKLQKRTSRAVTIDKSKIDIVMADSETAAGIDVSVAKGLDKKKGEMVERIVIPKKAEPVPPGLDYSDKDKKKMAKEAESAGPGWFNMKAPDLTDEVKRDIEVIRSRAALDPKRHYKKPDKTKGKAIPKFFQIGTVMDSATDFFSQRLTNKERKNGIVEELMANQETKSYLKKKFSKIQTAKEESTKFYRKPVGVLRGKTKRLAANEASKKRLRM
ncbi:Deoxynucleotidyltransferase terminal-interacting protein 2 [Phlyctochytrium planicorne]|nr:Deoxynucleotidyltransferase terminal-interacting protein 2 [Phlyctochytrium planicorne]